MSFHPLFTIEIGFYLIMAIFLFAFIGLIFHIYLSIAFYVSDYDEGNVYKKNKYYFNSKDKVKYDRVSIFDSKEKSARDDKKLSKLVLNGKPLKFKRIFGAGIYVKMTNINFNLFFFLILMFLFMLFLYWQSSSYLYLYGVKLPEVKNIFSN